MNFKKTELENGLRILTIPMQETQTVTMSIGVSVGSRYEKEKEAGISHFIEHMLFKGTKKRSTALSISEELDAIGGEFNAFTSKDSTYYYAKSDARHLETVLDVISDMYLNSKIEEKEIQKEKNTIIQEINMYNDMPMRMVEDVFENLLYRKNSLGESIAGSKKTVASFKRKNFFDYMHRFYIPNETVVCVAGKFDETKTINLIGKIFSDMKKREKTKIIPVEENQKNLQLKIKFKKTDQTHLILGTRGYEKKNKDRYVLALLATILGGNMSSRIFIEVREKRGLAYYVSTGTESFEDVGYLATRAGVEHKNLALAIETILTEYKKIAKEKVTEKELQKAKDYLKGKTVMGLEATEAVAMFFSGQAIDRENILNLEEKFALIDKVDADDILRVARDIFQNKKLNLAIVGPHKNSKEFQKILNL